MNDEDENDLDNPSQVMSNNEESFFRRAHLQRIILKKVLNKMDPAFQLSSDSTWENGVTSCEIENPEPMDDTSNNLLTKS